MASLLSAILVLALSSSFSHEIAAESARKELRSKLLNQVAPVLSNRIDPSRVVQVSWQPRVFIYKDFITDEECNHLISMARNGKEGNNVSNEKTKATGIMSSSYVKDDIVSSIEERISVWSFLPREHSGFLQVQQHNSSGSTGKYGYIGNKSALGRNEPLVATVILFLSNATQGGELVFPNSKEVEGSKHEWLRPTKGNAVLIFSVHPNTAPDKSSSHERRPVVDGELWCAVKLLCMRAIIPEEGLSDEAECDDQDDECPQWAARGECERNPVYMLGSPDYYGTCRKSCKVC